MYVTTFLVKEIPVCFEVLPVIHHMKTLSFDLCGELVVYHVLVVWKEGVPCPYAKSIVSFEYCKESYCRIHQNGRRWYLVF